MAQLARRRSKRMNTAPYDSGEFQVYKAQRSWEQSTRTAAAAAQARAEVPEAELEWVDMDDLLVDEAD